MDEQPGIMIRGVLTLKKRAVVLVVEDKAESSNQHQRRGPLLQVYAPEHPAADDSQQKAVKKLKTDFDQRKTF